MEANKSSSTQDQAVATTPAVEQTKPATPKHEFSIDRTLFHPLIQDQDELFLRQLVALLSSR